MVQVPPTAGFMAKSENHFLSVMKDAKYFSLFLCERGGYRNTEIGDMFDKLRGCQPYCEDSKRHDEIRWRLQKKVRID